ncbi:MAG: hypothetical protein ACYDCD_04060 [Candidatus Acidiferrales bacterium]
MPENSKKPNTFDVTQPQIPGVPQARARKSSVGGAAAAEGEGMNGTRKPFYLWAGVGVAAVIVLVVIIWWARAGTRNAPSGPVFVEHDRLEAVPAPVASAPPFPVAPGPVATTEELAHSWDARKFSYRNAGGDSFPAMVVRLPGNAYWAFFLRVPYGTCKLELVTDIGKLRRDYKFPAAHPMVADPCTHTLYDLTKYGSGPNGLVRGAVVAGTGIRPPLAIEVQVRGHEILATRSEKQ